MTDEIVLPEAPPLLRAAAQNILGIVERTPPIYYTTMSNLDKKLLVEYWKQIDGMDQILDEAQVDQKAFYSWYSNQATLPETISRARRWLIEHNYIIVNERVGQQAVDAGKKVRGSF